MKRLKYILISLLMILGTINSTASDCLCKSKLSKETSQFLINHHIGKYSKLNTFEIFEVVMLYLRIYSFHPLIKLKVDEATLINFTPTYKKSEQDFFNIEVKYDVSLTILNDQTKEFILTIDKNYFMDMLNFKVKFIDKSTNEEVLSEPLFIINNEIEYHQVGICTYIANLIFKISETSSIDALFMETNGLESKCMIWSDYQEDLREYVYNIVQSNYRLVDEDSPSYVPLNQNKKILYDSDESINPIFKYMVWNHINPMSSNFIFMRLLDLFSIDLNGSSQIPESEKVQFNNENFSIDLVKEIFNEYDLTFVQDNFLYINSKESSGSLFTEDDEEMEFSFDFGKSNLFKEFLKIKSKKETNKKISMKKENIYFALLVIEFIFHSNFIDHKLQMNPIDKISIKFKDDNFFTFSISKGFSFYSDNNDLIQHLLKISQIIRKKDFYLETNLISYTDSKGSHQEVFK